MKFTLVSFGIIILLMIPATKTSNTFKMNLDFTKGNGKITSVPSKKLPDERRQLSVFPKSNEKFMVTPLPYQKLLTQNPMTFLMKKPLMRKIVLQDKRPDINKKIERTTRRPVMNTRFMSAKALNIFQRPDYDDDEIIFKIKHDNYLNKDISMEGAHTEERTTIVYPVNMGNFYSGYGNPENIGNFISRNGNPVDTGIFYSGYNKNRRNKPITIIVDKIPKVEDYIFTPKIQPTEATTTEGTIEIVDFIFIPEYTDRYDIYKRDDFIFRSKVKPTQAIRKDSNIKMKDLISIDDNINIIEDNSVKVVQSEVDSITTTSEKSNINIDDYIFSPKFKPTEAIRKETDFKVSQEMFITTIKPPTLIDQGIIADIGNLHKTTQAINKNHIKSIENNVPNPDISPIEANCQNCAVETFSSEEIADQNEFIFLNGLNRLENPTSLPENIDLNLTDELDLTTEWVIEPKKKIKRSVNVIEEENLATTVSGFKFTMKDKKLSNDMVFRNIHS